MYHSICVNVNGVIKNVLVPLGPTTPEPTTLPINIEPQTSSETESAGSTPPIDTVDDEVPLRVTPITQTSLLLQNNQRLLTSSVHNPSLQAFTPTGVVPNQPPIVQIISQPSVFTQRLSCTTSSPITKVPSTLHATVSSLPSTKIIPVKRSAKPVNYVFVPVTTSSQAVSLNSSTSSESSMSKSRSVLIKAVTETSSTSSKNRSSSSMQKVHSKVVTIPTGHSGGHLARSIVSNIFPTLTQRLCTAPVTIPNAIPGKEPISVNVVSLYNSNSDTYLKKYCIGSKRDRQLLENKGVNHMFSVSTLLCKIDMKSEISVDVNEFQCPQFSSLCKTLTKEHLKPINNDFIIIMSESNQELKRRRKEKKERKRKIVKRRSLNVSPPTRTLRNRNSTGNLTPGLDKSTESHSKSFRPIDGDLVGDSDTDVDNDDDKDKDFEFRSRKKGDNIERLKKKLSQQKEDIEKLQALIN